VYIIFTCRSLISYAYWKTRISDSTTRSRLICNVNERRQHADKTRQRNVFSQIEFSKCNCTRFVYLVTNISICIREELLLICYLKYKITLKYH